MAQSPIRPRVVFVTAILTQYRAPLHEAIRARLNANGVDYELLYSEPHGAAALKGDTVELPWATKVPAHHVGLFGHTGIWQRIGRHLRGADLLILQQENKILHNYPLLFGKWLFAIKNLAFFGHGRNYQETRRTLNERWKQWIALHVDWWFAYTEQSAETVTKSGFSTDRITVVNNAIDTGALRANLAQVSEQEAAALRTQLGIEQGAPVGLFIGGLYREKRLKFLLSAAEAIWRDNPDFVLLVAGDGPERDLLQVERPYLRVLGSRFGRDKAVVLKAADLLLMPGLVGLVVLDAFCAGLPLVTTAIDYHSPEFAYLTDGVHGVVVQNSDSPVAYAEAVSALIADHERRARMSLSAAEAADRFSIEAMADRFADGMLRAISSRR